jgi:dipeptidase D
VLDADYPEWEYKIDSPIRDLMKERYKALYDQSLKVDAIHAGLECGLLKEKVGDIDMISIGPDIYDVHTPSERLSISSTKNVYNFLCDILENIREV